MLRVKNIVAAVAVAILILGLATSPVRSETPPADSFSRYIVVFRDGVDADVAAASLVKTHGLRLPHTYRHALSGMGAEIPSSRLLALQNDPRVAFVEADQEFQLFEQAVPTGIQRIFADHNPSVAISSTDQSRVDVDVAVIDTGIDFDHPDLNVVARTDCSGTTVGQTGCLDNQGDDAIGHGTHVAGIIGALDNGIGVVGVAPGARLWAVKVFDLGGPGNTSSIIAGVDWVTAHADQIEVANMSLGCQCTSRALNAAINRSIAAGVVYVVAAGNSNINATLINPANHPDVITVSAIADFDGTPGGLGAPTCLPDRDDTGADFSNYGRVIDIAAPGICITSTWKDGTYSTESGTSMAAPHVTGAVALVVSGANSPSTKEGVMLIRSQLLQNGNRNWIDDSNDGVQEPLLDVSNATVFAPARVPAPGDDTSEVAMAP